jgi:hypothetical protein
LAEIFNIPANLIHREPEKSATIPPRVMALRLGRMEFSLKGGQLAGMVCYNGQPLVFLKDTDVGDFRNRIGYMIEERLEMFSVSADELKDSGFKKVVLNLGSKGDAYSVSLKD